TQLEALGLKFPTLTEDSLTFLRGLTSLKVLSIEDLSHVDGVFSHLPRLPNLEAIDLTFPTINGRDLRRLSVLPRLKALDMKYAEIGSDADLKDLAQLESLEDLVISGDHVSPEVLESLSALQHLRSLHITPRHSSFFKETDRQATFVLDRHATLSVLESEAEGFRRALGRLRRRNPGINIDNNESSLRRYFGYFHGYVPDESYEGSALESAWLPERLQYSRSPGSAAPRAANGGQGVF
ncbi:MAG TPA: hypothetical protein VHB99_06030, partial [Pirellulales bacterium]|nr:hypothetical protein [Pirellulales bacterium]